MSDIYGGKKKQKKPKVQKLRVEDETCEIQCVLAKWGWS